MLVKEYRIPMPMSVAEYRIAQLYMIQKKSREESQGQGSGVEIIENRPYENGLGGNGQYTRKIYHISKHIPSWFVAILPKDALVVYEEAWNAYPHTRTRYTCPFIDKFSIDIETKYFDDPGDRDDVFESDGGRNKAVDLIDIISDSGDMRKDEDPRIFISEKTRRGPLSDNWLEQAKRNHGTEGHKVMCSYKLCKVEFKYWGMQSKIERFIHDVALRKTMARAHRQAWCWQDEWVGLTMEDIRRLERETQAVLEKKFGADLSVPPKLSSDSSDEAFIEEPTKKIPINNVHFEENGVTESDANHVTSQEPSKQGAKMKNLVRQTSSSSIWSNHSRASGKEGRNTLAPSLAEWRMQSIEQHSDQSSDEEEFFDASDNFGLDALESNNLHALEKCKWSSVESLNEQKRAAYNKFSDSSHIDPAVAYQISVEDEAFSQPSTPIYGADTCAIDTLFLVLHGGNPVDADGSATGPNSKQADVNTLAYTFDAVAGSHYQSACGRFVFRLVTCPPVYLEACNSLKNLCPLGNDGSASLPFSSALVAAYATYSLPYTEAVSTTLTRCNAAFHAFVMSPEGKGFSGQVCIIADSMAGLITYDMLSGSAFVKRSNSMSSSRRGSTLTPHEEEDHHGSSNSLPSSPKLRFTYESGEGTLGSGASAKEPQQHEFDPLKVPSSRNRRYSANYCLDVQKNASALPAHIPLPRRSSSPYNMDGSRLEFEVADVFILGSPLGVVLALRNSVSGSFEPPARPACGRVYNVFYLADPTSSRLEPLLDNRFSKIPVVDVARFHKFPLGDGRSLSLGDSLTANLGIFLEQPVRRESRRGSEWSVSSYNGEGLTNVNQSMDSSHEDLLAHQASKDDDQFVDEVAARWFGDQRIDYALFCPESLSSFPSVSLPHLFYASFWESTDLAAFIIRQVVHQENVALCLDCEKEVVNFTPLIPREKWQRRRTQVKIRNVTSNHRAKDIVAIEGGEQQLLGRFTYGPLDVVALTGEKIDIYINTMTSSQDWSHIGTETTDSHGKICTVVPPDKKLPLGIFPVKMVVRGDLTTADSYLAVLPPQTDCVIFSIDGSFAASVSLMGSDPKVRPGSVDVVRHWQELGYLIIYVTARPDMQKHRVVTWLAHHNFPHGPVWFSDGLTHDPLKQKTNLLKQLQTECKLNYVAGYGSSKDVAVYTQLGLTSEQIYIIGKISKKHTNQCEWLSDGYSLHLRQLKSVLKPAKYNAQIAMRKGCFGLPGHRSHHSKSKRSSSKRGTISQ